MIDILLFILGKFIDNGAPYSVAIGFVIALYAGYKGVKDIGKKYFEKLRHKRNSRWIIVWLFFGAFILMFWGFKVFAKCPHFLTITVAVIFLLFTVAVFGSVRGLVFFPKWYVKKYNKLFRKGYTIENKSAVDKRPFYFLDTNERIEFEYLTAQFCSSINDHIGAYNAFCRMQKFPLYDSEVIESSVSCVYLLTQLGDMNKAHHIAESVKEADYPAYCFLESYILECKGKLEEAFDMAQKAESAMDVNYKNIRVRQGTYNQLGRLYLFKGNSTEAYRYLKASLEDAKKLKNASTLNTAYNNLINFYLLGGKSKKEVDELVEEYRNNLEPDSLDTVCQLINLRVRVAKHFDNRGEEECAIREGYEELKRRSKYPYLAMQRISILHMLQSGGFDTAQVVKDIENDLDYYGKLPEQQRFKVYLDLAYFINRADIDPSRFEKICTKVSDYLENNADSDLDNYYKQLSTACVGERCFVLQSKVDLYVLLSINKSEQLQLLKDVRQIYHDNGMCAMEADVDTNIVKYYAQCCEKGYVLSNDEREYIYNLLDDAVKLSDNIPVLNIGELLINIASGYDFFGEQDKSRAVLTHFYESGLVNNINNDYVSAQLYFLSVKYGFIRNAQ